jgi:hypothetical protein
MKISCDLCRNNRHNNRSSSAEEEKEILTVSCPC